MNAFKRFATNSPVLFGLLITLLVWVFYVAAGVLGEVVAQDLAGQELSEAIGRLAASFLFLYVLWRFGWLDASGVTRAGTLSAWLVTLFIIAYETITYQLPIFGDLAFRISDPGVSVSVGSNAFVTGLIEEIPFRGIILYAFLRLWGDSRRGIIQSVLYSSVLFGGAHLIHVALGKPLPQVTLKAISTFLSGIYFAALMLRWKTIWTVVIFHGLLNAVMSIRAIEVPGFTETTTALGLIILLQVPVVVFGAYLISWVPPQPVVPNAS